MSVASRTITRWSPFAAIFLGAGLFACSTASDRREEKVMAGDLPISPQEGEVRCYFGEATSTRYPVKEGAPPLRYQILRQHILLKASDRLEVRQWVAPPEGPTHERVGHWERVGGSDSFVLTDQAQLYQGRATVIGGTGWDWSRWRYNLVMTDRSTDMGSGRVTSEGLVIDSVGKTAEGKKLHETHAVLKEIPAENCSDRLKELLEKHPLESSTKTEEISKKP